MGYGPVYYTNKVQLKGNTTVYRSLAKSLTIALRAPHEQRSQRQPDMA